MGRGTIYTISRARHQARMAPQGPQDVGFNDSREFHRALPTTFPPLARNRVSRSKPQPGSVTLHCTVLSRRAPERDRRAGNGAQLCRHSSCAVPQLPPRHRPLLGSIWGGFRYHVTSTPCSGLLQARSSALGPLSQPHCTKHFHFGHP